MSEEGSRKRLGRGLAALLGEMDPPKEAAGPMAAEISLALDRIDRNSANPRTRFSEADIEDLARSIAEHGIVQPLVVRPGIGGNYEIIAGERRWRAARQAGLSEVPVIVRDVDDRTALEIAIVENVQRTDLNPIEEARGYQQLIDDHGYTQIDLAKVIGKSRSHVANTLRLLKLPERVRELLVDGALSAGHARTLITVEDPEKLAKRIVEDGLSVRQAEELAQGRPIRAESSETRPEKDVDTRALEKLLSDTIGMSVKINPRRKGGELRIAYRSLEQLDEICRKIRN